MGGENEGEPKNTGSSGGSGGDDVQNKRVKTEGKLVGRDMEKNLTIINVKGRNKNTKNDLIESVELPKAKREKGAKLKKRIRNQMMRTTTT